MCFSLVFRVGNPNVLLLKHVFFLFLSGYFLLLCFDGFDEWFGDVN